MVVSSLRRGQRGCALHARNFRHIRENPFPHTTPTGMSVNSSGMVVVVVVVVGVMVRI